jgi:diguanylate cyclase (GGDEF)-like protein/PAS domain S-box-containing protein
MSSLIVQDLQPDLPSFGTEGVASHRHRAIRVLFLHRDANTVASCLQELRNAQFAAGADVVLTLTECAEKLHVHSYDVIVVEYPSPNWPDSQALQCLHQTVQQIPLLFVTSAMADGDMARLAAEGILDYVEREHLGQLPMIIRRLLKEKKLHADLEQAGKALRHSQTLYRMLLENPAYGICRCDPEGKFLDVNQALLTMLGYATKDELWAANRGAEIVLDLDRGNSLPGSSRKSLRIEPVEIEWKRKNGTILKARVSGRGVFNEHGGFDGYQIIAVDVTEQRAIEEQLRHQAFSDSLTGLANHGRLFDVLQAEIGRSQRTGREFSLLLLDLDGLKKINDQFGHLAGDRALCRLARIVTDCCRSIDVAARHGGDEFALVLPETGVAAATLVAIRICDLLAKDAEKPTLSVSVGLANYPQDAETIADLLSAADRDLYAMKYTQKAPAGDAHPSGSPPSLPVYSSVGG